VLLALRKDWGGVSLRWWTLLRERCPLKITRAVPKIVERQKRQIPEGRLCLHRGLIDLCLLALDSRSVPYEIGLCNYRSSDARRRQRQK
jgi:hypothetical protein